MKVIKIGNVSILIDSIIAMSGVIEDVTIGYYFKVVVSGSDSINIKVGDYLGDDESECIKIRDKHNQRWLDAIDAEVVDDGTKKLEKK